MEDWKSKFLKSYYGNNFWLKKLLINQKVTSYSALSFTFMFGCMRLKVNGIYHLNDPVYYTLFLISAYDTLRNVSLSLSVKIRNSHK